MRLFNISEIADEPINWKDVESKNTEQAYTWAIKKERAATHQKYVFSTKLTPYEKLVVTSYDPAKFSTPVSHSIKYSYRWWGIPKGIPNGEVLWKTIKFYVDRWNHAQKLAGKYGRLAFKLKKIYQAEIFNDLKDKTTAVSIPSADVPRKIYYSTKNYFNNPYWEREAVVSRYAGPVGHFPDFSTVERNTLIALEQGLRRFGIPGMTKMYGCTIKPTKWTENQFVVYGADDRLVWKRVRGNIVYIDGKKVSITPLTNSNVYYAEQQKKLLEPLTKPKLPPKTTKIKEEVEQPSEWENVPLNAWSSTQNYAIMNKDRINKVRSFHKQDDILLRRLIDIEQDHPEDLLSKGIPDPHDPDFLDMEMPVGCDMKVSKQFEEDPNTYQLIKVPGRWFWEDMRFNDNYADCEEEFYVLKSSPRFKHIVNILNRHNQLMKYLQKLGAFPPAATGRP